MILLSGEACPSLAIQGRAVMTGVLIRVRHHRVRMLPALLVPSLNLVKFNGLRLVPAMAADVTNVQPPAVIARRPAMNAPRLAMNAPRLDAMNVRRKEAVDHRKVLLLAPKAGVQKEIRPRLSMQVGSRRREMMITGRSLMAGFGTMMLRKSQRRRILLWPLKGLMTKILMMMS